MGRLRQALGWPSHCLRAVDRYRREQGIQPDLDVPPCALLRVGPPQLLALECQGELLCESGLHWRKRRP